MIVSVRRLSGKYGGKPVLLGGVVLWTLCDVLTIPAEPVFPILLLVRAGMGLGEGVNFPSLHDMSSCWFPAGKLTLAFSFALL